MNEQSRDCFQKISSHLYCPVAKVGPFVFYLHLDLSSLSSSYPSHSQNIWIYRALHLLHLDRVCIEMSCDELGMVVLYLTMVDVADKSGRPHSPSPASDNVSSFVDFLYRNYLRDRKHRPAWRQFGKNSQIRRTPSPDLNCSYLFTVSVWCQRISPNIASLEQYLMEFSVYCN